MDINQLTDKQIVEGILARDKEITRVYLYEKCYPLFKAIFDKYKTDCQTCIEFINEIYVYIMTKGKRTRISKLEGFGFNCTLVYWLKIITENYCHQLFKKKNLPLEERTDGTDPAGDLIDSNGLDLTNINMEDLEKVLNMMSNDRYRMIIIYRYVEQRTNEETANLLGINMRNYYNKHRLAKQQFRRALIMEGLI